MFKLEYRVNGKSTFIVGASYVGKPLSNTVMFISKKIEQQIIMLENVEGCLVFAENGVDVPERILDKNVIVFSVNPQLEYAKFVAEFEKRKMMQEKTLKYNYTEDGYYVSETAVIGENAMIEPGVLIGHNVSIGDNAVIMSGSVIKNAVIGNSVVINEYALIGTNGFTMAEDVEGNKIRIASLGKVIIGDYVEIGAHDNISRGSGGNTFIDDYAKIDALVHVGHDAHIASNVEITAGSVVGGFAYIGQKAFIGINSTLRNRIQIGESTTVGMGAVVTKSISSGQVVVGNPAHSL